MSFQVDFNTCIYQMSFNVICPNKRVENTFACVIDNFFLCMLFNFTAQVANGYSKQLSSQGFGEVCDEERLGFLEVFAGQGLNVDIL